MGKVPFARDSLRLDSLRKSQKVKFVERKLCASPKLGPDLSFPGNDGRGRGANSVHELIFPGDDGRCRGAELVA